MSRSTRDVHRFDYWYDPQSRVNFCEHCDGQDSGFVRLDVAVVRSVLLAMTPWTKCSRKGISTEPFQVQMKRLVQ